MQPPCLASQAGSCLLRIMQIPLPFLPLHRPQPPQMTLLSYFKTHERSSNLENLASGQEGRVRLAPTTRGAGFGIGPLTDWFIKKPVARSQVRSKNPSKEEDPSDEEDESNPLT